MSSRDAGNALWWAYMKIRHSLVGGKVGMGFISNGYALKQTGKLEDKRSFTMQKWGYKNGID